MCAVKYITAVVKPVSYHFYHDGNLSLNNPGWSWGCKGIVIPAHNKSNVCLIFFVNELLMKV